MAYNSMIVRKLLQTSLSERTSYQDVKRTLVAAYNPADAADAVGRRHSCVDHEHR
jgi:hypothetical protein